MKSNSGKDNLTLQRLNIFENNKVIILTVPKIAHSWCNTKFLGEGNRSSIDSEFAINYYTYELSTHIHKGEKRDDEYFKKIEKTWNTILDKKEKRDLVILYRNPYEHFLSAFMQDYSKNFYPGKSSNQQVYWEYFIESLQVPSIIKTNFINDSSLEESLTSDIVRKYPEIANKVIDVNFDSYLRAGSFENGHYRTWLSFINRLITSNVIDSNKVRFVDIYDAPLEIQLKNVVDIETGPSYDSSTHSWSFSILDKLVSENTRYYDTISSIIKYEMIYYQEIKTKYKKNHLYGKFQ